MTTTQSNQVTSPDQSSQPTPDRDLAQLVAKLATDLDEKPFTHAYHQMHLAAQILGGRAVQEIAEQALALHTGEGMLTNDGTRRRTAGGIFFALVKQKFTQEQLREFYQRRSGGQRRAQSDDKPAATTTKPTTQPVAPSKSEKQGTPAPIKKSGPAAGAQQPQGKKPMEAKAGQAGQSGKRKPMALAVNHRKSGKPASH